MPTISIDKTDGCQVYLSKESLSCDIISAKSSEMNILIPKGDGDFVSKRNDVIQVVRGAKDCGTLFQNEINKTPQSSIHH